MDIRLEQDKECPARIKVVGVGGAGGNAVDRMIRAGLGGVEFVSVNTDAQALAQNLAPTKVELGEAGLGAGADPEIGRLLLYTSRVGDDELGMPLQRQEVQIAERLDQPQSWAGGGELQLIQS